MMQDQFISRYVRLCVEKNHPHHVHVEQPVFKLLFSALSTNLGWHMYIYIVTQFDDTR